jgi:hypothetical protein
VTNQILTALKVNIKAEKIYEKLDIQGLFKTKLPEKKEAEENFLTKLQNFISFEILDSRSRIHKRQYIDKKIFVGGSTN